MLERGFDYQQQEIEELEAEITQLRAALAASQAENARLTAECEAAAEYIDGYLVADIDFSGACPSCGLSQENGSDHDDDCPGWIASDKYFTVRAARQAVTRVTDQA